MDFAQIYGLFAAKRYLDVIQATSGATLDDYRLRILKAASLAEIGQVDEALQVLDSRVPEPAAEIAIWITKSNIHMLAHRYAEAAEAALKALALSPERPEALINAACALICLRRCEEAIALLEKQPRALSETEELYLTIARIHLAPTDLLLSRMERLCGKINSVSANIMAADAFFAAGYTPEAVRLLAPHKYASARAGELFARASIDAGNLAAAHQFALDERVGLNAKADVFCALRDHGQMHAIQEAARSSPRAYRWFQREGLLPGSRHQIGEPHEKEKLLRLNIHHAKKGWTNDGVVEVMELALALGETLKASTLISEIRNPMPRPQREKLNGLLQELRARFLVSEQDMQWCEYRLSLIGGDAADAWAKLSALNAKIAKNVPIRAPVLPSKDRLAGVEMPIILVFGMSRSGKTLLGSQIAKALGQFTFLDELKIFPADNSTEALNANLRKLADLHPGGLIFTVPHPGEQKFFRLLGSKLVKPVIVLRDEDDLALRIFEKQYESEDSHAYSYAIGSARERVRWYQQTIPQLLLSEADGFVIRFEEFGSRAKMDELAAFLNANGAIEPLEVNDAELFADLKKEMVDRG